MDGTLLDGRVIYAVAERFGFKSEVDEILATTKIPYIRSKRIAKLLKYLTVSDVAEVIRSVPLTKGAVQVMKHLKTGEYKVGVISDSYSLATEILSDRLGLDFHIANRLVVKNSVVTGVLKMPMGWERIKCSCMQSVCKRYSLIKTVRRYGVDMSNTVAVGDSGSDRCMIGVAGVGIWFNPVDNDLPQKNESVIRTKDLRLILKCLKD